MSNSARALSVAQTLDHQIEPASAGLESGLSDLGLAVWQIHTRSGHAECPPGTETTFRSVMRLDPNCFQEGRFAFTQIVHPDDKDPLIATLTEGLSNATCARFRLIDPETREERWIRIQMKPGAQCIWCVAEDQTHEVQNQEKQKRDFTRRILSSLTHEDLDRAARNGVLTTDLEQITAEKWRPSFEEVNVKWIGPELAPQGPPCSLNVSVQLVGLMLDSLLQNALEAVMDPRSNGSNAKWVRFESFDDSDFVYFAVTDSGLGIDLSLKSAVFEPFVSTKSREHTGLGLTLAREIAELHGGSLKLDHFSQATRFIAQLPKQD